MKIGLHSHIPITNIPEHLPPPRGARNPFKMFITIYFFGLVDTAKEFKLTLVRNKLSALQLDVLLIKKFLF